MTTFIVLQLTHHKVQVRLVAVVVIRRHSAGAVGGHQVGVAERHADHCFMQNGMLNGNVPLRVSGKAQRPRGADAAADLDCNMVLTPDTCGEARQVLGREAHSSGA